MTHVEKRQVNLKFDLSNRKININLNWYFNISASLIINTCRIGYIEMIYCRQHMIVKFDK